MSTINLLKVSAPAGRGIVNNVEKFLSLEFHHDDYRTLVFHHDEFYEWVGSHWVRIDTTELEGRVQDFFAECYYEKKVEPTEENPKGLAPVEYSINRSSLSDLMRVLRNRVVISYDGNGANQWIQKRPGEADPVDLVPLQNGILNVWTRELQPPTPRLFNKYSLSFNYDAETTECPTMEKFLNDAFGSDHQRRDLLQEVIGLLCTPENKYHKLFFFVGEPRAGKSTMVNLIKKLIGPQNMGATTLSALAESHGMADIADKPVVSISDASNVGKSPRATLDALKSISGGDPVRVNPKGKQGHSGVLPIRFILAANEMPELPDRTGALRQRTVLLKFTTSFEGREDRGMDVKLARELPAIFNWALAGLTRLRERYEAGGGDFVQPDVGKDDLTISEEINNPDKAFVQDWCEVGPSYKEATALLQQAWVTWRIERGMDIPEQPELRMTKSIKEVVSTVTSGHKLSAGPDGKRPRALAGIRLNDEVRARIAKSMNNSNPLAHLVGLMPPPSC
jgi:putative DNA primase/helicase